MERTEAPVIALKNVLVATDFGEPSASALRYGAELARRFGASLHVLHVLDDLSAQLTPWAVAGVAVTMDEWQTSAEVRAQASLEALIPASDRAAIHAQFRVLVDRSPANAILAYARDQLIDLVIIGTHGRHGLSYFFLGSVAQHVARLAPCPVLTVRATERDFIQPDALQAVDRQAHANG